MIVWIGDNPIDVCLCYPQLLDKWYAQACDVSFEDEDEVSKRKQEQLQELDLEWVKTEIEKLKLILPSEDNDHGGS